MSPLNLGKTSLIMVAMALLLAQNDVILVRGNSTFIASYCEPASGNYSRSGGDDFAGNLEDIAANLLKDALGGALFSDGSAGSNNADQVFGMYYCDGAFDASDCNACVSAATRKIQESCNTKEAIVWYLGCTLRYANRYIYSEAEVSPQVDVFLNPGGGLPDTASLRDVLTEAMKEAAYNTVSRPPAYGAAQLDSLFAVAQCSPDIVSPACSRCLMKAAATITTTSTAVAVFLPSCHLRYTYQHPPAKLNYTPL